MSDLEQLAKDATTRAALSAGKDAAKRAERAVGSLLADEEAPAKDESEKKSRNYKIIAVVVLGLFAVIGIVGLLLSYWYWFLVAGVVGLAGLIGYSRLKSRLGKAKASKQVASREVAASDAAEPALEPARTARVAIDDEPKKPSQAELRAAAEAKAKAIAEAEAIREQEVDDELAAMKARLKK